MRSRVWPEKREQDLRPGCSGPMQGVVVTPAGDTSDMSVRSRMKEIGCSQLRLLTGGSASVPADWELDERTRSVGRVGVAQAREALRRAKSPEPKQPAPIRKAS